jgi:cysteine-rich repeat protein
MRTWLSIMLVLFGSTAWAGVPEVLHYQGYLADSDGAAIHCPSANDCAMADGLSLVFRLYDQETDGDPLWETSYDAVTINYGVFNILLGAKNALDGSTFDHDQLYLGITINGGEELTPRQRLVSTAFALRAGTATIAQDANSLGGIDAEDYITLDEVGGLCVTEEELTAELASKNYCTSCYTDDDVATYLTEKGYTAGPGFSGSFDDLADVPAALAGLTSDDTGTLSYLGHPIISPEGDWLGPSTGDGEKGEPGPKGDTGEPGKPGAKGDTGEPGKPGDKGDAGDTGLQGDKGDAGDTGLQGDKGVQGDTGLQGDKGDAGDTGLQGDKGVQGDTGLQGDKGVQGNTGIQGDKGVQGDTGLQGDKGVQGIQGPKGDPGIQGVNGDKGDSCTVVDNGDGTKTISCDDGTLVIVSDGADGTPGAPGKAGTDGKNGDAGQTSLLTSGPEAPGANCKDGGVKVSHGLDVNGDGTLAVAEVQGTAYICNGADAAAEGVLALPKAAVPPKQCTSDAMGEQYFDTALTSHRTCNGTYWVPVLTTCGDDSVGSGEECDDGNQRDGDGCQANCLMATPTLCALPCVEDNTLTAHVETAKLVASNGVGNDQLGFSSSIHGERAVIGASYADSQGPNSGAAYVYEAQPDGTWTQVSVLLASDGAADDNFGIAVSIHGDWLVVGARLTDTKGQNSGAAYLFKREANGVWSEKQILVGKDTTAGDYFGHMVSLEDDRLVVTASKADAPQKDSGAAYVYERQGNDQWVEVAKLTASDGAFNAWFGWSCALDGDTIAVGAQLAQIDNQIIGAAYVFERQGNGSWNEVSKLVASDGTPKSLFGYAVSIVGQRMVVGSYREDPVTTLSTGGAYIFERQQDGSWMEIQKLLPADGNTLDVFGFSLAMSGERIIAGTFRDFDPKGSNGATFIFTRQNDGQWKETEKVMAVDGADGDFFGWSVAMDGNRAVVGAIHDDDNGDSSGSAYVRTFGALCTKQGVCICQAGYGGATCNTQL